MSAILEQDYLSHLYIIQSQNPPSFVLFDEQKKIYDIDLSTRTIDAPKVLSVEHDHNAETIYFRVDRFHDYMDLSNTICVVQYVTPDGGIHVYPVPFYDVVTERLDKKMIIPWCVNGAATQKEGQISYSIRFYRVEEGADSEYKLTYNLSTLVAKSEVKKGMQVSELSDAFDISAEGYDSLLSLIQNINREGVYWDIYDNN